MTAENSFEQEQHKLLTPPAGGRLKIESLLRQPCELLSAFQANRSGADFLLFFGVVAAGLCSYGLLAGSFSGGTQLWAAPLKLALGLLFSALMCLPSFYIFACMSGVKAKADEIIMLLLLSLALAAILLVAVIPIVWIFSEASASVSFMGALHIVIWFIAVFAMASLLRKGFDFYGGKSSALLRVWLGVFIMVTLQMAVTLRPIVGSSDTLFPQTKKFFISHWIDTLDSELVGDSTRGR